MYKKIIFCLDNSEASNAGVELGLKIAQAFSSNAIGCHVYAARLHNMRFSQMEEGLPPRYQNEEALAHTREVHGDLITKGLKIISDSYVSVFLAKAKPLGIDSFGVSREGKNFEEILKEIEEGGYGLAVLGAFGLGRTAANRIGSVCERVARSARIDLLIARDSAPVFSTGNITVCIDGSQASFGALKSAIALSKVFKCRIKAVSAFDPDFHTSAFRSLAGVLSDEAARLFRFREQETLHEEIIDKGLARIYKGHLDEAASMARSEGVDIKTTLLSGKPCDKILEHIRKTSPFILALGATGVHSTAGADIGSTAENLLRESGCNVLISRRSVTPEAGTSAFEWDAEASKILSSIPSFVRPIVKDMVEEAARKKGLPKRITAEFMRSVRKSMEDF